MSVTIDRLKDSDKADWRRLYNGYAAFYKMPMTDETAERVWGWLHDADHVQEALVARDSAGRVIGLAHFRAMPSPLRGAYAGFLDDLFVDPGARGSGAADGLAAGAGRALISGARASGASPLLTCSGRR